MGKVKVRIIEQELKNNNNEVVGKLAILISDPTEDPSWLDDAVHKYVGDTPHNQWIDSRLDNPWVRVITTGLNKLDYYSYDKFIEIMNRNDIIDEILNKDEGEERNIFRSVQIWFS